MPAKRASADQISQSKHRLALLGFITVCGGLVFWNLGANCLWEDEAQTAVVGNNILLTGLPAASDGKNLVSILPDGRDVRNGIYIWQGWFPSYVTAGSMAIFGHNAFAARLPFAAFFIIFIAFFYLFLKKHADSDRRVWLTLLLTVTCVPLLLHARQCRYYSLALLLTLFVIDRYLSLLRQPKLRDEILLIISSTLLLNSFFPGGILLALALGIDLIRRNPGKETLKRLAITLAVIVLINFPVAWFCRIWDRQFSTESALSDPAASSMYLLRYLLTLNNYFFPIIPVAAALAVHWKQIARNIWKDDISFLFLIICLTQLIGFSLLSDYPFTRYIIGIAPFVLFFGAKCIESLALNRQWLVWVIAIIIVGTNLIHWLPLPLFRQTSLQAARWSTAGIDLHFVDPDNIRLSFARGEVKALINTPAGFPLLEFIKSIVHPPPGPIDKIVEYLQKEAAPGDRVKPAYGDLPLMFHTNFPITSSVEVGPIAPEWIIPRHFRPMKTDETFLRESSKYPYTKIKIPFPDLQWNNQPDPLYHYYGTPANDLASPITILKKG